ncbi:MAG: hypothetical protein IH991_24805 [Planctomycetes bacterium]|nr:hypothetical protein [Planctomycetota bacterium]
MWWEAVPEEIRRKTHVSTGYSNIHPADYIGPESCKECHPNNYAKWSEHPHRWMNARPTGETVKGDFSGRSSISYLGGKATFYREAGGYRMRLERRNVRRVYEITQTIGSRFFQYYVGRQLQGPESPEHKFFRDEHVLGFGYWLDREEWVPIVHVGDEQESPDGERPDPFNPASDSSYMVYAERCNQCHTTFSLADQYLRGTGNNGRQAAFPLHWSAYSYLREAHPQLVSAHGDPADFTDHEIDKIFELTRQFDASEHAVTWGISCEACHFGAKSHAVGKRERPEFFPSSPHLFVGARGSDIDYGRSRANLTWACGRCHVGERPQFAAGIATWNSTECSDAMRGACYSQLTCIDCHDPHEATGAKWPRTAEEDDASCIRCHKQYELEEARSRHTHHPIGSEGSRCMNCHMPRINEGLQDVVRTHTIFSPTRADMIEANHPNACNLCHLDQPIRWTMDHLHQWYGASYDERRISRSYPDHEKSVGLGWLESDEEAIRLVAADALTRTNSRWALPQLLNALDDPYMINRQFARIGLEKMLDVRLSDFGYRFYMTPKERREPLIFLRAQLIASESDEKPAVSEERSKKAAVDREDVGPLGKKVQ